ncbi:MAG: hypothetical protein WBV82_12125 [Myxococcaceae bacterium]
MSQKRGNGRGARVVVAQRAVTEEAEGPPAVLHFDFDGRRERTAAPEPRPNASIKQAIIRWLNEQL